LGLDSPTLANGSFENGDVAAFLEAMLQEWTGRFVVVGDGGRMPKGDPIRALVAHIAERLVLERLPPDAPRLNPVEPWWSWRKWARLSSGGPRDAQELDARVIAEVGSGPGGASIPEEPVPCLGPPASARIPFLTLNSRADEHKEGERGHPSRRRPP
jgi:DDE superfamily endonuclease